MTIGEANCTVPSEEKTRKAAVYPGNVISYDLSAGGIEMAMDIDRINEETMTAVPVAILKANVCLEEDRFILSDFALEAMPQI